MYYIEMSQLPLKNVSDPQDMANSADRLRRAFKKAGHSDQLTNKYTFFFHNQIINGKSDVYSAAYAAQRAFKEKGDTYAKNYARAYENAKNLCIEKHEARSIAKIFATNKQQKNNYKSN